MSKYKVLVCGDLVTPTGFSNVLHAILDNMPRERLDIVGLGVNYFGDPHKYNFPIYPAISGVGSRDVFGFEKLPKLLEKEQPDLIFILNDPWLVDNYLVVIKKYYGGMGKEVPKIVVYFPVDSEDHEASWYQNFDVVTQAVVYTKFGQDVVKKAVPDIDTIIIPHGVDTDVFRKIFNTRKEAKENVFRNAPTLIDTFMILNANRNQPRKRLDITLRAFKIFAEGKDDVRIYMHCGAKDAHIDVASFAKKLGIDNKLILTNLNKGVQAIPKESLNAIYNACDVGINTCYMKGTPVLTKSGYTNIEDIKIGDTVFSHTGVKSAVTNTFEHDYTGEMLKIYTWGSYPIHLTPNHKLFADIRPYTHLLREYKQDVRDNPNLKFIRAEDLLIGSVLTFPVIKDEKLSVGEKEAFIYGAYLAEGSTSNSGIRFSLNQASDDFLREKIIGYMKEIFSLEAHIFNYSRNRQTIEFYSVDLKRKFEALFGKGAHNKRIPEELIFLNRKDKISLLKAHFLGDGHLSNKSRTLSFSTVSEPLARSLWLLLTTLGYIAPTLKQAKRGDYVVLVSGTSADNLAKLFELSLRNDNNQQRDKTWADDKYVYFPVRKIEHLEYNSKIYDLEVEGEHSYLTHYAGHNSLGEGWGLTAIEHAATGAPQIVPNHSALGEIYSDCGVLVKTTMPFTLETTTTGYLVHEKDVAKAMDTLYKNRELYDDLSKKSIEKFSSSAYNWHEIARIWYNLFLDTIIK